VIRALTSEQMTTAEQAAVASGMPLGALMERAGTALAEEVGRRAPQGRVAVVAGPGNNGGDGWVAARVLRAAGREVRVFALADPTTLAAQAAWAAQQALEAGVAWQQVAAPEGFELAGASCVVDAILGIGAHGELREPVPAWVEAIDSSDALVVAADVPTGVDADTGAVAGVAVAADVTVTFSVLKRGLVQAPGSAFAGEVVVADVGVPESALGFPDGVEVWEPADYASLVPVPAPDAHKNSRGRLLVIAGSSAFPGASVLAVRGAQRAGAGYVTLATPHPAARAAQAHLLSAPVVGLVAMQGGAFSSKAAEQLLDLASEYDAVELGPGLTMADGAVYVVRELVRELDRPLVIDADGLNAIADAPTLLQQRTAPTVLTPHPGELARLLGKRPIDLNLDRVSAARILAAPEHVVVLKGAGTVIADGVRTVITAAGTPALATAGTGDVLAGVIGGLLAQGLPPFEAGALGAWLHGRAGEAAAADLTPVCVTADDVPEYLPAAVAELLGSW
jgi:NAD(P)H-hydrate epimerase